MQPTPMRPRLDRRTFLAGVAATGMIAACGGGDDDAGGDDDTATDGAGTQPGGGEWVIVQRVPDRIFIPGPIRYPVQLSRNADFVNDGPDELVAEIADIEMNRLGLQVTATRRDAVPAAYYDFRFEAEQAGIYRLLVEGGPEGGVVLQVYEDGQVGNQSPGEPLAGFDTPTFDQPGDMFTVCTRDPQCPFHEVTLTEALTTGKSVVYLVGTPAFCSSGTCTPGLEALVDVMSDFDDVAVAVHAEVYADDAGTMLAPAMAATGLIFEPAVFITGPDGVITDRLDGIWNADELRESVARATA